MWYAFRKSNNVWILRALSMQILNRIRHRVDAFFYQSFRESILGSRDKKGNPFLEKQGSSPDTYGHLNWLEEKKSTKLAFLRFIWNSTLVNTKLNDLLALAVIKTAAINLKYIRISIPACRFCCLLRRYPSNKQLKSENDRVYKRNWPLSIAGLHETSWRPCWWSFLRWELNFIFTQTMRKEFMCTSMHLCNEYARSATTYTDSTRNIYEKLS